MIRLDRYLAESGLGSRDFVKNLIKKGRISVTGVDVPKPETKIAENGEVFFDGKPVRRRGQVYLILHKPAGYLTAKADAKEKTVMDLIPDTVRDLAPVGRLDKDTEGLLLITNDGDLAHRLLAPKNEVPKTYYLRTETPIRPGAEEFLLNPVAFQDFTSKPAFLCRISETEATLTVTEGKFHEVKRLMSAAGSEVAYLKRISFGPLTLGDLKKGETRELTEEEVVALRSLFQERGTR